MRFQVKLYKLSGKDLNGTDAGQLPFVSCGKDTRDNENTSFWAFEVILLPISRSL